MAKSPPINSRPSTSTLDAARPARSRSQAAIVLLLGRSVLSEPSLMAYSQAARSSSFPIRQVPLACLDPGFRDPHDATTGLLQNPGAHNGWWGICLKECIEGSRPYGNLYYLHRVYPLGGLDCMRAGAGERRGGVGFRGRLIYSHKLIPGGEPVILPCRLAVPVLVFFLI
jgi:hypothetical protein